mgnify:CR=1 FL=1
MDRHKIRICNLQQAKHKKKINLGKFNVNRFSVDKVH